MHHELKTLPEYFQAVQDGRKTFEIRRNDRGFRAGDTVLLREHVRTPDAAGYTGRECRFEIGYVTDFGQQSGYVVFSLFPISEVD